MPRVFASCATGAKKREKKKREEVTAQFADSIDKFLKRKQNGVEGNVSTTPDVCNEETSGLNLIEETVNVAVVDATSNSSRTDNEAAAGISRLLIQLVN